MYNISFAKIDLRITIGMSNTGMDKINCVTVEIESHGIEESNLGLSHLVISRLRAPVNDMINFHTLAAIVLRYNIGTGTPKIFIAIRVIEMKMGINYEFYRLVS